jgi:hypothetical protein
VSSTIQARGTPAEKRDFISLLFNLIDQRSAGAQVKIFLCQKSHDDNTPEKLS